MRLAVACTIGGALLSLVDRLTFATRVTKRSGLIADVRLRDEPNYIDEVETV